MDNLEKELQQEFSIRLIFFFIEKLAEQDQNIRMQLLDILNEFNNEKQNELREKKGLGRPLSVSELACSFGLPSSEELELERDQEKLNDFYQTMFNKIMELPGPIHVM